MSRGDTYGCNVHQFAETPETGLCDLVRSLGQANEQLSRAYAEQHGLHPTDFKALLLIDGAERATARRRLTAGELACQLGLSSGAVTYLVERLAGAGTVSREADQLDRRKVLLVATVAGHELAEAFVRPLCGALGDSLAFLDHRQQQQLRTALERLAETLRSQAATVAA